MLTEVLEEPNYIHVPFAKWDDIYSTVVERGLIGVPLNIIFHYRRAVQSEVVVGISPIAQNTKFCIAFEGYTQTQRVLQDNNNDFMEDNNAFNLLSDTHQKQLMQCIYNAGLLGEEVNVLCKVNNNLNEIVKISYREVNDKQSHTLFTYRKNIREIAYVISNNNPIEEVEDLLKLEPVNIFLRRL